MERLTYELCEKGTGHYDALRRKEYATNLAYANSMIDCVNKLGRIEDIEEELGCPIDVFITAIKQKGIFTDYGYVETDNVGYTSDNKFVMSVDRWEYEQQLLLVSDYKRTWWLKEDKSE